MSIYSKHLRRLGIGLIALNTGKIVFSLIFMFFLPEYDFDFKSVYSFIISFLAIATGAVTVMLSERETWLWRALIISMACMAATSILAICDEGELDAIINTPLLLIIVIVNQEIKMIKRLGIMRRVGRRALVVLDLRITGKSDLFDPMVMGPHLEVNAAILNAVDRFLETNGPDAPLCICFHSIQSISTPLRETLSEVFRAHYEDEQRRIDKYLESRSIRSFALMCISILALRLLGLKMFRYDKGLLWQILSNFAAFSLWQIGSTYFERAEANERLVRVKIAMEAKIMFY